MRLPHVIPFGKFPLYFFTACTQGRRAVLACPEALSILTEVWTKSASLDGWQVGRFMLMPDHVHFFAMPALAAKPRADWIKMWKSVSARRLIRDHGLQPPLWQEDTFDHLMRSAESYAEKWNYVRENPVRAGYCATAGEWPWQGEVNVLRMQ
ncbi:MAG: REP-associated tyrosine transposase [Opitutales bacterium]